jgi:hypothetical protein
LALGAFEENWCIDWNELAEAIKAAEKELGKTDDTPASDD